MSEKVSYSGLFAIGLTSAAAVGLTALSFPFILPALRKVCLPYVPATEKQVQNVIKMLQGRSGNVIDLGSGDGRIVIAAAKAGYTAYGVELNPWLVMFSHFKAFSLGLGKKAHFSQKDIWKTCLGDYDNVVIFGVEEMMELLEKKLYKELSPESHVIACRFPLPNWTPISTISSGINSVWLYKRRSSCK